MRYESEMFMKKLKKDSSVALYQQLINEIKESIQAGELKPGDRLMTEGEFSKEYDSFPKLSVLHHKNGDDAL